MSITIQPHVRFICSDQGRAAHTAQDAPSFTLMSMPGVEEMLADWACASAIVYNDPNLWLGIATAEGQTLTLS